MMNKLRDLQPVGICRRIVSTFNDSVDCRAALTDLVTDYPTIRPRVCLKLMNRGRNGRLMETVPYIPWLDLAIVFHIPLAVNGGTGLSIAVDNALMEQWGSMDAGKLYATARANTQRLFPESIREAAEGNIRWPDRYGRMYMATNAERLNGAGVVLYDGLLRSFSDKAGKNLFMLAPSAHEMLIVPEGEGAAERLAGIIRDVNREAASEGKGMLSDSVYYYNRETDSVRIW